MIKRILMVLALAALIAGMAAAAGGKMQIRHLGDIGQGAIERHQSWMDE
jgi:hypothetical protein